MPKRQLVLVEWVDSHSGRGWRPLDEIAEDGEPTHCKSVGWQVRRTRAVTVLVPHISGGEDGGYRPFGTGEIAIPNRAIVSRTVLAV